MLEDDADDAFFVRSTSEKAGFANPIIVFATAEEARRYLEQSRPKARPVFILDVKISRWRNRHRIHPLAATAAFATRLHARR
jgi:hypothetical protein